MIDSRSSMAEGPAANSGDEKRQAGAKLQTVDSVDCSHYRYRTHPAILANIHLPGPSDGARQPARRWLRAHDDDPPIASSDSAIEQPATSSYDGLLGRAAGWLQYPAAAGGRQHRLSAMMQQQQQQASHPPEVAACPIADINARLTNQDCQAAAQPRAARCCGNSQYGNGSAHSPLLATGGNQQAVIRIQDLAVQLELLIDKFFDENDKINLSYYLNQYETNQCDLSELLANLLQKDLLIKLPNPMIKYKLLNYIKRLYVEPKLCEASAACDDPETVDWRRLDEDGKLAAERAATRYEHDALRLNFGALAADRSVGASSNKDQLDLRLFEAMTRRYLLASNVLIYSELNNRPASSPRSTTMAEQQKRRRQRRAAELQRKQQQQQPHIHLLCKRAGGGADTLRNLNGTSAAMMELANRRPPHAAAAASSSIGYHSESGLVEATIGSQRHNFWHPTASNTAQQQQQQQQPPQQTTSIHHRGGSPQRAISRTQLNGYRRPLDHQLQPPASIADGGSSARAAAIEAHRSRTDAPDIRRPAPPTDRSSSATLMEFGSHLPGARFASVADDADDADWLSSDSYQDFQAAAHASRLAASASLDSLAHFGRHHHEDRVATDWGATRPTNNGCWPAPQLSGGFNSAGAAANAHVDHLMGPLYGAANTGRQRQWSLPQLSATTSAFYQPEMDELSAELAGLQLPGYRRPVSSAGGGGGGGQLLSQQWGGQQPAADDYRCGGYSPRSYSFSERNALHTSYPPQQSPAAATVFGRHQQHPSSSTAAAAAACLHLSNAERRLAGATDDSSTMSSSSPHFVDSNHRFAAGGAGSSIGGRLAGERAYLATIASPALQRRRHQQADFHSIATTMRQSPTECAEALASNWRITDTTGDAFLYHGAPMAQSSRAATTSAAALALDLASAPAPARHQRGPTLQPSAVDYFRDFGGYQAELHARPSTYQQQRYCQAGRPPPLASAYNCNPSYNAATSNNNNNCENRCCSSMSVPGDARAALAGGGAWLAGSSSAAPKCRQDEQFQNCYYPQPASGPPPPPPLQLRPELWQAQAQAQASLELARRASFQLYNYKNAPTTANTSQHHHRRQLAPATASSLPASPSAHDKFAPPSVGRRSRGRHGRQQHLTSGSASAPRHNDNPIRQGRHSQHHYQQQRPIQLKDYHNQQQQQQHQPNSGDDSDDGGLLVVPSQARGRLPMSVAEQMKQQANTFLHSYGSGGGSSSGSRKHHPTPKHSRSSSSSARGGQKPCLQVRRTLRVKIKKSKPILGIAIEGGFNVSGQLLPRIVCVHEDGAAYQCGKLRASDLILEVNGQSTVNMTHDEIAKTIATAYYQDPRSYIEFLIGESIHV